ncbi:hypothetical protein A8A54_04410 [Brucella pseudogrignonensis]|uniref:hypothetical protein n=1 Tax=Brucella pseudogrignonensis TaxID=419475 RepID=UPI0007DA6BFB|nr:hypothetical protein [Brucella pseudogrignonensis]ANG95794.1 hypothetical protein A8A54_04410 [Brucella pseudogrignonensis]
MSIVLKSPSREKLETKLQKLAKLQSEIKRLENADKVSARKLDSRRKIVIGGCVIKAVSEGKLNSSWIENLVLSFASERDKAIFDFAKTESENGSDDGVASANRE